ncbi:MAG: response regulator transcription factor [Polyangiales bacterium]
MARKKILLVDDSNTILMMEKMLLKEHYDLITAVNGEEAVAKAKGDSPDLILMDVVMPKMNGFEALKAIRGHEPTARIPVIMVTTRSEMGNVELGFDSGCSDYVTKPINTAELMSKVKNFLGE